MRKPSSPPTPPTVQERDGIARTYSYTLGGTVLSLTQAALQRVVIHRRDAVSASRRERRRMAVIMQSDRMQARVNKAIQRQLDRVEKRAPPPKIRVRVDAENRKTFERKPQRITPKSYLPLPSYGGPIVDRQGRRGIVMTIDYDGAKKHAFGIMRRRVIYISDPEHCEIDGRGNTIFFSNIGDDIDEILMGADLAELSQRESRVDAKLDVNIIIQMPFDVPQETRAAILKAASYELFGRHGLPYAAALHEPDLNGDQRNFHGHICGSWRPMTRTAPYCWEVAEDFRGDLDGAHYWRHARRRVAEIMTAMVQRGGVDRHYTHLSNAERGLVHKPQKKLDKRKTRAAREGGFVPDVEANRRRMTANVALEQKLELRRRQQRERVLKRKLALLGRVEWTMPQTPELQPAQPLEFSRRVSGVRAVYAEAGHGIRVFPEAPVEANQQRAAIATEPVPITQNAGLSRVRSTPVFIREHAISGIVALGVPGPLLGGSAVRTVTASVEFWLGHSLSKITTEESRPTFSLSLDPINIGRVTTAPLGLVTPPVESGGVGSIEHPRGIKPGRAPVEAVGLSTPSHAAVPTLKAVLSAARGSPSLKKVTVSFSPHGARANPVRPVPGGGSFALQDTAIAHVSAPVWPTSLLPRPLEEVTARSSDWQRTTLHPVGLGRSVAGAVIRPVRTTAPLAGQTRLRPVAVNRVEDRGQGSRSVVAARDGSVDHALQQALNRAGALMDRLSKARELIRDNETVHENGGHGNSVKRGSDVLKPTSTGDENPEVVAARAFVDRVRNKAVRVGENKAGLVIPHPIYWTGNGLTKRGLRDPAVQTELKHMRKRQVDYMNRITPILQAHVDHRIVRQGAAAMAEALPEEERAEAREWAKTGIWTKAMEWLRKNGERRSILAFERWEKACEKEASERFAKAAEAMRRHQRWPLDLDPKTLVNLRSDADRHAQMLAAEDAVASAEREKLRNDKQSAPVAAPDRSLSRPSRQFRPPDFGIGD